MEQARKYFGTDGIRGKVGETPIVPDFVLKLGWAIGHVLGGNEPGCHILIGKDTRISGYVFESALEAGLVSAGVNVDLLGPLPTPAIAFLTKKYQAKAGIVISASHNPHHDNGIKLFSSEGYKLSDSIEHAIEKCIDQPLKMVPSEQLGKARRLLDAVEHYTQFCQQKIAGDLDLGGMTIILDCANGASYHIAPSLFAALGARVYPIFNRPDGLNINQNCGSTHPEELIKAVIEKKADLGIAFDGDADRVLMVDSKGELVDGDELLFIIAIAAVQADAPPKGVVGTQMSNLGLELALKEFNVPFLRAKVGDRYVLELLRENEWQLGGESSGHLIHLGYTTSGDGIASALLVLKALQQSGCTLNELKKLMRKLPQTTVNVKLTQSLKSINHPELQSAVRKVEAELGSSGRVLLRPSGTEPLVRVMVEGEKADQVKQLAHELADKVSTVLEKL